MKHFLKVLIPLLLLFMLAACTAQISEPTPTATPPLPAKAEVVAAFFRATSERQKEEALSYLAEDVRLNQNGICFSGKTARVNHTYDWGKSEYQKTEWTGENYRVDGDLVHLDFKEFSHDGILIAEGSKTYSVSDGLIQWEAPCEP